jgi:hypothetical protein
MEEDGAAAAADKEADSDAAAKHKGWPLVAFEMRFLCFICPFSVPHRSAPNRQKFEKELGEIKMKIEAVEAQLVCT